MEIEKYIGQFLLKNSFCYIHGLGNLELVKRPAVHDGKALQAPSYEVVVTAGGSIDDSFANFIATNEQISISKAANALREFSIQARKDMQAGKEVPVPGIGKFTEENGRIRFTTDANFRFTPAGIPTLKNSKQLEEQKLTPPHKPSFPPPAKANSVNWPMVFIVAVLLIILGGGGYGFWYYQQQQRAKEVVPVVPMIDTTPVAQPIADTMNKPVDTMAAKPVVDTNAMNEYKLIIGEYNTKAKAESRFRRLKIDGKRIELVTKDSVNFQVLETVNCRIVDTTHYIDSLRKFYGFKGVGIYHN